MIVFVLSQRLLLSKTVCATSCILMFFALARGDLALRIVLSFGASSSAVKKQTMTTDTTETRACEKNRILVKKCIHAIKYEIRDQMVKWFLLT